MGQYRMAHEVGDRISRDRIITLTDAVLAIVMTLLVLEIVVPQLSHSEIETELPNDYWQVKTVVDTILPLSQASQAYDACI